MAVEIRVPPMGESVSEATVAKWLKQEGDAVQQDETVAELETDKVTLEVNAPSAGVLSKIMVPTGKKVGANALLGKIEAGAAAAKAKSNVANTQTAPKAASAVKAAPATPTVTPFKPAAAASAALSPAVRKMVAENNVNPAAVQGSGKDGRLTKGDVLQQMAAAPTGNNSRREERVRMTRLRQRIAERLKQAQNTAAMLTTFNDVDMTNLLELRSQYKDDFEKKYGVRLGFMSFFVKAAIQALKTFPAVNAEIDGEDIVYKHYYDIGVAVGTEQGLVVPVVRNADQMSIPEIEKAIAAYGEKARAGKISMDDLTGGTFTISNGGVFGSMMSTPIINPPQSAILGMHRTEKRPVVVNDQIVIRSMMYLALSYDHRIIDGSEAVRFLKTIKEAIEDPQRLLLGV